MTGLDIHRAAASLFEELSALPWFVGVEIDEAAGTLIVEHNDQDAAIAWGKSEYAGFAVEVREGKALVHRGKARAGQEDQPEMIS